MPNFDRDALRKGSQAIDEAVASRGKGGDFRPFLSNIFWQKDKDEHYLLFLHNIEEIPEVLLHPFIDANDGVPHMIMDRTWAPIGERHDPIHDQWNYKSRLTNLAIAVELEPTIELVNDRPKPVGFEVKMREFERRIRDEDGELTEEREEVMAPAVGLVAQSPYNFFNQLKSYDAADAPIHTTPLKITRLGQKDNVTYSVVGYDMIVPDRSGLLNYIENVSYVTEPAELLEQIADLDEVEASLAIGEYLLYKRMDELCDPEIYDDILSKITKPAKFGDTKKKGEKKEKPARQSQRRSARASEESSETTAEDEPKATKVSVGKSSPITERLAELKAKSRAASKAD